MHVASSFLSCVYINFCFVTLHSIIFNIISTKGDQLDWFTYLIACHVDIFAMILYVFFYFCGK